MPSLAQHDRRTFLDWLSGGSTPPAKHVEGVDEIADSIRQDGICLVWKDGPGPAHTACNPLIVVSDRDYNDFIAWASTYVKSYAPFTAYFRVLKTSELYQFYYKIPCDIRLTDLERLSGVVIAEAIVQMGGERPLSRIPLQACEATFSFAVLQALRQGTQTGHLIDLSFEWSRARSIASEGELRLPAASVAAFWTLALAGLDGHEYRAPGGADDWVPAVFDLIESARNASDLIPKSTWSYLRRTMPNILNPFDVFELPREEQLRVLDKNANLLSGSDVPRPLAEAFVGFQAARLGNGSFDYFSVLEDWKDSLPSCLLWFALFSIWRPGFDGLINGQCLGRRVARQTLADRDVFSAPSADISLGELEALSSSRSISQFRSGLNTAVEVEIWPLVSAKFRTASRANADIHQDRQSEFDTKKLKRTLEDALRQLSNSVASNAVAEEGSGDLFPTWPSNRRKPKPKRK